MQAVIFDLDGTLVDSVWDIQASVNRVLAEEGQEALDVETIKSFVGDGLPKLTERVILHLGLDMEHHARLTADILQVYETADLTHSRLYPGVEEALAALKAKGYRMGVCTNKPFGPAVKVLMAMGIDHFFEGVIGGDSLAQRKPDPAPLIATMEKIGATQVVFVGDSEIDGETAQRAEIPFALFSEGYRKREIDEIVHCAVFSDYDDLVKIVSDRFASVA